MKILIYLLRKKKNKEGKSPLYLRFTETIRSEVFINVYVHPDKWDNDNKTIIGNDTETRINNNRLTYIQLEADKIVDEFKSKREILSVHEAKEILQNRINEGSPKKHRKANTFLEILQLYIDSQKANINKAKIDGGICEETYKTYIYRQKRIIEFLDNKKLTNIKLENLDKNLIAKFIVWAKEPERKFEHTHVNKHIKLFKTVAKYAVENQITTHNLLLNVKIKDVKKPLVFLNQNELRKIMNHTFASQRLHQFT